MNRVTIEVDGKKHVLVHTNVVVQCKECSLYTVCKPAPDRDMLCVDFFNSGYGHFEESK